MKVLWVDDEGKRYIIEADTIEECREIINHMRELLNKPKPDIEYMHTNDPEIVEEIKRTGEDVKTEDDLTDKGKRFLKAIFDGIFSSVDPKNSN
jgi:hypothetical protein